MSRVGKEKIDISKIKSYKLENKVLTVEGTLGVNNVIFPDFLVINENSEKKILTVELKNENEENKHHFAMHGTVVRLIKNAVVGVTTGFKKNFLFKGLGYKFTVNNDILTMNLGYSMPIVCSIPKSIKGTALKDKLEFHFTESQE
jgi:large subunit ribosomal protein L6